MRNFKSLDNVDRNILHEIQRDGRISFVELAEKVGLSKSPCLKRLRALEKAVSYTHLTLPTKA